MICLFWVVIIRGENSKRMVKDLLLVISIVHRI